jgi:hypothetical protein
VTPIARRFADGGHDLRDDRADGGDDLLEILFDSVLADMPQRRSAQRDGQRLAVSRESRRLDHRCSEIHANDHRTPPFDSQIAV